MDATLAATLKPLGVYSVPDSYLTGFPGGNTGSQAVAYMTGTTLPAVAPTVTWTATGNPLIIGNVQGALAASVPDSHGVSTQVLGSEDVVECVNPMLCTVSKKGATTITATAAGQSATLNVYTYGGLGLSTGTDNQTGAGEPLGLSFNANGESVPNTTNPDLSLDPASSTMTFRAPHGIVLVNKEMTTVTPADFVNPQPTVTLNGCNITQPDTFTLLVQTSDNRLVKISESATTTDRSTCKTSRFYGPYAVSSGGSFTY
jgi:hypothetical protein